MNVINECYDRTPTNRREDLDRKLTRNCKRTTKAQLNALHLVGDIISLKTGETAEVAVQSVLWNSIANFSAQFKVHSRETIKKTLLHLCARRKASRSKYSGVDDDN